MSQLGDITRNKEIETIEKIEPKAIFLRWEPFGSNTKIIQHNQIQSLNPKWSFFMKFAN